MTMQIDGSNGWLFGDGSRQGTAGYVPFRNKIINGAMVHDQRGLGGTFTPTNGQYTLDRWSSYAYGGATAKFTVQQNAASVTPPNGFTHYLGATSTSSYSIAAGDITSVLQVIEGYNVADLGWGAAGASSVTLSFWVRSSLTGTFGGSLRNSAANRSYPFTYNINAANTWEYKTITAPGDTTGTWNKTNGQGLFVMFSLGTGSTFSAAPGAWASGDYYSATGAQSVVGTSGATLFITGVQLEKGVVATSFEYRMDEEYRCYRYFQRLDGYWRCGNGDEYNVRKEIQLLCPMRSTPTVSGATYGNEAGTSWSGSVFGNNTQQLQGGGPGYAGPRPLINGPLYVSAEL